MASGSYSGKNLTRAALLREVGELTALKYFFNEGDDSPLLNLRKEELAKVMPPPVDSYCPLCSRVFHVGDALCNCKPASTKKSVAGGKTLIDCPPRIVGLTNRHMLRAAMAGMRRYQRKFGPYLKRRLMQAATPVYSGPFKPPATEPSPVTA